MSENGLSMRLENLLAQKKSEILKEWFDLVIKTYPEDTAAFYKQGKDHFANPVGSTIKQGLKTMLDELYQETDPETLQASLDSVIRIRAVQQFRPSEAISFIFSLKSVIYDIAHKSSKVENLTQDLAVLESKIDTLALAAFDIYMSCREKVYDLKANEIKNRTFRAFKRANLIADTPLE